jgi:hypothetical protein
VQECLPQTVRLNGFSHRITVSILV